MARSANRLTDTAIRGNLADGMYADGAGLYLQVKNGGRSWVMRYKFGGTPRMMGLGPQAAIRLATARTLAEEAHALVARGVDPIADRQARKDAARIEAAKVVTFQQAAERLIKSKAAEWSNDKHAAQWTATLETYAFPVFGALPVQEVDTGLVMKALEPIWQSKTETATRVRQRVESVLDWAKAHGYRTGENAARWKGHLDKLLPKASKVKKVKHHEALPYNDISAFFTRLKTKTTHSARALQWAILTAARTGETLFTDYAEIDFDEKVWTIPADRMKAKRPHRVPLTPEMLALLDRNGKGLVFPNDDGNAMSDATMLKYLRETFGYDKLTVHGFRSSFRDWSAERTNFPNEVCEMALAHVIKSKSESAYRRGDLLDRRRPLMEMWSAYCHRGAADGGKVVKLREA